MLDYLFDEFERHERGLGSHYLFLYNAVRGLEAKRTLEFGAGVSTRVILDALRATRGHHISISTDPQNVIKLGVDPALYSAHHTNWTHHRGLSDDVLPRIFGRELQCEPFDLVLHDGSHSFDVVERDLTSVLPYVRKHGLVLVHDTLHSYAGIAMRGGLRRALSNICPFAWEQLTLPFGFGLTILRVLTRTHLNGEPLTITRCKSGSTHFTDLEANE